jgi:hypothetical protein
MNILIKKIEKILDLDNKIEDLFCDLIKKNIKDVIQL